MSISSDTGQFRAITPKYISASVFEKMDEEYGKALVENGGHIDFHHHFDGERKPRWWEITKRFLSYVKHVIN